MIEDTKINCVFICSESHLHDLQVRTALKAGKHVCVEFPLTYTADQAESLWHLAQHNGLVLHVEVIGSLTAHHQWARRITRTGEVTAWSSHLTGGLYRWVQDMARANLTPLLAFGRLYQAVDLFGSLTLKDVILDDHLEPTTFDPDISPYYLLDIYLETASGISISIKEERGLMRSRKSTTHLYRNGHELIPQIIESDHPKKPLFELDLMHFLSLVSVHTSSRLIGYATSEKLIEAHQICDQVTQHLAGTTRAP